MPSILILHACFQPLYRSSSYFRFGEKRLDELRAHTLSIRKRNAKSE